MSVFGSYFSKNTHTHIPKISSTDNLLFCKPVHFILIIMGMSTRTVHHLLDLPNEILFHIIEQCGHINSMDVVMFKHVSKKCYILINDKYGRAHQFINIQIPHQQHFSAIKQYLPPIESLAMRKGLLQTHLKHEHDDNANWLVENQAFHISFMDAMMEAVRYQRFELMKLWYERTSQLVADTNFIITVAQHSRIKLEKMYHLLPNIATNHPNLSDIQVIDECLNQMIPSSSLVPLDLTETWISLQKTHFDTLKVCIHATIQHGNLEMVDWLMQQQLQLQHDDFTLPHPYEVNHNKWYALDGFVVDREVMTSYFIQAVRWGHRHIMDWLMLQDDQPDMNRMLLNSAILYGDLAFNQYVFKLSPLMDEESIIRAARMNDLDTLSWLANLNCPMPSMGVTHTSKVKVLQWLQQYCAGSLSENHVKYAVEHDAYEMITLLYKTHPHLCHTHTLLRIALNAHQFQMATWLCDQFLNATSCQQKLLSSSHQDWMKEVYWDYSVYQWLTNHELFSNHVHQIFSSLSSYELFDTDQSATSAMLFFQCIAEKHHPSPTPLDAAAYNLIVHVNRHDYIDQLYKQGYDVYNTIDTNSAMMFGSLKLITNMHRHQCAFQQQTQFFVALETRNLYAWVWSLLYAVQCVRSRNVTPNLTLTMTTSPQDLNTVQTPATCIDLATVDAYDPQLSTMVDRLYRILYLSHLESF